LNQDFISFEKPKVEGKKEEIKEEKNENSIESSSSSGRSFKAKTNEKQRKGRDKRKLAARYA